MKSRNTATWKCKVHNKFPPITKSHSVKFLWLAYVRKYSSHNTTDQIKSNIQIFFAFFKYIYLYFPTFRQQSSPDPLKDSCFCAQCSITTALKHPPSNIRYTHRMVVTDALGQPTGPIFKCHAWHLKMGQIGWTATLEWNYHSMPLKIPKQCTSHIVAEAWNHASGIPVT
jgi:hypothetical protein